jgi:DNA polymerase-3 subunit gamma/tau
MAYEVTASRRRPKTFDELAGQEFVTATLKNSIESGCIAHAYLFSGPRGCGKTSAARILARSLNCEKGPTANPCGECSSCREISRGASLDIIEIDGASNTGVNDVRQIKDEVLFPPNAGRYKVYIIDEVHMLSNNAFNALLKTIEEPPPYIVFIFATTEIHKVPATIKSRCQQFSFRLIPLETIQAILKAVCAEMDVRAEEDALFWIAKESTGSLRDAYTLFDQVISFSGGHIRSQLIREKLGLVGLDQLNALGEACAKNDTPEAFALIDGILESGVVIEQFVIDLAGYYRSLLLLKNGIRRESLLGYGPGRFSALVLERLDSARIEQALSLLLDLYRNIRYSVSPRFELETTVSKLSWLDRWVSPPELRAAVAGAREALGIAGNRGPGNTPEGGLLSEKPGKAETARDFTAPGALTSEFNRFVASRERKEPEAGSRQTAGGLEAAVPAYPPPPEKDPPDPGGQSVPDLIRLREAVIGDLKRDREILASGLEKSLPWEWAGDRIIIPLRDALTVQLLKKDAALIREVFAAFAGKPLPFEVSEERGAPQDEGESPEIPAQAETVRRVFRGTIVKSG